MCYPCTHCNKCGSFTMKTLIVCADCHSPFPVGVRECPECGSRNTTTIVLEEPKTPTQKARG